MLCLLGITHLSSPSPTCRLEALLFFWQHSHFSSFQKISRQGLSVLIMQLVLQRQVVTEDSETTLWLLQMDSEVWPMSLKKIARKEGRQKMVREVTWKGDKLVTLPAVPSLPHTCVQGAPGLTMGKPVLKLGELMDIDNLSNQLSSKAIKLCLCGAVPK